MQLNTLQQKTKRATTRRVGRGGRRGKTSGRGTKGQKARAGHRIRPEVRDTIKKLPKLRGRGTHPNKSISAHVVPVNLERLERVFKAGDTVTPRVLLAKHVIASGSGRVPTVKILGTGTISKKLTVTGCAVSASARAQIEKAGGTIL
ncbi:MAG TPA: uL15 family ribosomal protein [Candidatus Paceibacterota bacterium]